MPTPTTARSLANINFAGFTKDLEALRKETFEKLGEKEYRHLRKIEWWGRLCTILGYATAWLLPNPISALLISQGLATRWLLAHHICHGGYDQIPGVPTRYTSKGFAKGWRRFVDWFDWIHPDAWCYEHNYLHHYHTGEAHDPDVVERHLEILRQMRVPRFLKWIIVFLIGITYKVVYYAPNTLNSCEHYKNPHGGMPPICPGNVLDVRNPLVRRLWLSCYLPMVGWHFLLIPLLFLPLGWLAVLFVLINRILAEFMHNFHTYMIIGPNHTGADLYRFNDHFRTKQEFYVNGVLGSVNYHCGGDLLDFSQMWLNYQIEHHLFPNMPMLTYREIQPRVKALCEKHNIPYIQESVFTRFRKFVRICIGDQTMVRIDAATSVAGTE